MTNQSEEVKEEVDQAQLFRIFQNSLGRAKKGEYGLVFLGHTDDDGREVDQPPLVGFVSDYKFGSHDGRPTILADVYLDKSHNPELLVSQFPRRSVEIVGKNKPDGFIDSLALLKRSPERDLGLITSLYQRSRYRNNQSVYRYMCPECAKEKYEHEGSSMPDLKAKKDVARNALDLMKNLLFMLLEDEMGGMAGGGGGGGEGGEMESMGEAEESLGEAQEALGEAEEEEGEEFAAESDEEDYAAGDGEEDRYECEDNEEDHYAAEDDESENYEAEDDEEHYAAAGFPSATTSMGGGGRMGSGKTKLQGGPKIPATSKGTSSYAPEHVRQGTTSGPGQKMEGFPPTHPHKDVVKGRGRHHRYERPRTEKDRMIRDQNSLQVSRYTREIQDLKAVVQGLQKENVASRKREKKATIERRLVYLQGEGYDFDVPKHVERFMRLPDEAIEAEIENIRENYSRSPVNQPMPLAIDDTIDVGGNGLPEAGAAFPRLGRPIDQDQVMRKNNEKVFGESVTRFAREQKLRVSSPGGSLRYGQHTSPDNEVGLGELVERFARRNQRKAQ
jgi:hypothetical protein